MNSESTWGPWESASRDRRPAQPYRLQKGIRVMANGPDGLAISDSRSRISGVVTLPPLPATSANGKECQIGKGESGLPQLEEPW